MDCLIGEVKWPQFIEKHFKNIRVPFSAGMELLPECNFRCVHCYAESDRYNTENQMTTEQICKIIDILVENECFQLYFTGGECLLHKDFFDIYKYAKKKGMLISVLTNGSLINQKHIELWREYPPELVSISMYGATSGTYYIITKDKNGYNKFMSAISLLEESNIHHELKIVGMKQNINDIIVMREFIRGRGQINSILAWDIRPMNSGDQGPISDCRVTPEQAMEIELQDPERWEFMKRKALDEQREEKTERQKGGYLYPCDAGKQFVFITYAGYMQACVKAVDPRYDLLHGDFDEGWEFLRREFVDKKASPNFTCLQCKKFKYCGQCTAAFKIEMGDPEIPVPFYCELGELRKQYMDDVAKGADSPSERVS